ncbi:hypothetical protein M408DRAFT_325886 [Serendipita vermifera MAFF 305830]|uniref:Zn(2)-C6 fungal-type domain-containing protein n=1 Tax=Serendipita vermifera MAFF 305830 TaxID=933852 RepID=A0A0C2X8Y5_SERVB|nr:hypothetical protein M408DRAFT_325886 [Serendipita vermifera MAFF 305830]
MPPAQEPKLLKKPCAECRRLKIKCDRTSPCGNCVKRGVAKVCPDSTVSYSGGRFVLTGTSELHGTIQDLSIRVKKLEAALQAAHSASSTMTHPLLLDEERVPIELDENVNTTIEEPDPDNAEAMFSMLSIETDVSTSRMTASHYSLWYLDGNKDPHHAPSVPEKLITSTAAASDSLFPIDLLRIAQGPNHDSGALRHRLMACLPSIDVATSLVEEYYENAGCIHNIVSRSLFDKEFWPVAYGGKEAPTSLLAVIFNIFCLGAMWHPALPSNCLSPSQFNHLAVLAMSQDPISIAHIEALCMQAVYLCVIDATHSKAWACLGLALKLAQTMGIDRDCALWLIPDDARQRRRRVFNELHTIDCFMSMLVGRTNVLSAGQHNTPPPDFNPNASPMDAVCEKSFRWQYVFLGHGVQSLLALVLSTEKPATYKATLELDKKLRSYDTILDPRLLKELGTLPKKDQDTTFLRKHRIQQIFISIAKEATLLHLHRSFLNRALVNPTGDPILSKWSISVMAAYQSSCSVIRTVRLMKANRPEFMNLLVWSNIILTAVISLGGLIIKTPYSSLASVALQEMQSGCELLEFHYPPDHFLLPVISRLRTAAVNAFEKRDQHPLMQTVTIPEVKRPLDDHDSNESTPPGPGDILGSIFDLNDGVLDAGFFSTARPLDPSFGGMNWHFAPVPPTNPFGSVNLNGINAAPPSNVDEQSQWAELLAQLGSPPSVVNGGQA